MSRFFIHPAHPELQFSSEKIEENRIQCTENRWNVEYLGTREDLLNSGIASEGMFPVAPKRVSSFHVDKKGNLLSPGRAKVIQERLKLKHKGFYPASQDSDWPRYGCARRAKGGMVSLTLNRTHHDQEDFVEVERRRRTQAHTPGEFAGKIKDALRQCLWIFQTYASGKSLHNTADGKYKLTNHDEIMRLMAELSDAVERSGGAEKKVTRSFHAIRGGKAAPGAQGVTP